MTRRCRRLYLCEPSSTDSVHRRQSGDQFSAAQGLLPQLIVGVIRLLTANGETLSRRQARRIEHAIDSEAIMERLAEIGGRRPVAWHVRHWSSRELEQARRAQVYDRERLSGRHFRHNPVLDFGNVENALGFFEPVATTVS